MDDFKKLPIEEISSSSSSSDDDMITAMGAYLQHQQQVQKQMLFVLQLRQVATELTPSASRPRVKKRCIKRDREVSHDRLYKDSFAEDLVYNEH